jgi:hypothetical protein
MHFCRGSQDRARHWFAPRKGDAEHVHDALCKVSNYAYKDAEVVLLRNPDPESVILFDMGDILPPTRDTFAVDFGVSRTCQYIYVLWGIGLAFGFVEGVSKECV